MGYAPRKIALLSILVVALSATSVLAGRPVSADPGAPPSVRQQPSPPPPTTGEPKPLDPLAGRAGANRGFVPPQGLQNGRLPPRQRAQLVPAAYGARGANINQGYSVSAVYAAHTVPVIEFPASSTAEYLYTTLKPPSGCLEGVTGHYRLVGDVTRDIVGFYDWCGAQWKTVIELTPEQRAKYVTSNAYLYLEVLKAAGTATWWGLVFNWVTRNWDYLASSTSESGAQGWTAFEQTGLESNGCPSPTTHYLTDIQVYNGTWTSLAPPYGTYFGPNPASNAACTRSYYWDSWFSWPSLQSWAAYYRTPEYLLPFPGGRSKQVTCIGTGCANHDAQYNQYSWDFGLAFGEDVVATRGGTVLRVVQAFDDRDPNACDPSFINQVNYILVDHGGGVSTQYAHLKKNSAFVTAGQLVKAGARLGQVGSSGYVCGYHLHFKKQVTPTTQAEDLSTASLSVQFDDGAGISQGASATSDNWAQP